MQKIRQKWEIQKTQTILNKTQHMQLQDTKEVLKGSKSNRMNKAHIFYEILSQKKTEPHKE